MYGIPGLGFAKPNEKLPPLSRHPAPGHKTSDDDPAKAQTGDISDASQQDVRMGEHGKAAEVELDEARPQDQPRQADEENGVDSIMAETPAPAPASLSESVVAAAPPTHITAVLDAALQELFSSIQQEEQSIARTPDGAAQEQSSRAIPEAEGAEWEVDSDPLSPSSDSSSDSSGSDSDADGNGVLMGVEETAKLLMEMDDDSDAEGDKSKGAKVRTKNEMDDVVIPRPDVEIKPDTRIVDLGTVQYVIDSTIVVQAFTSGEYQVLDSGSVVCTPERVVAGVVADLLGQVRQPTYTVRFTSENEIKALGLQVGSKLCYIPDHSTYIFTEPLRNLKGSDASNLHDEEVGVDEAEFSDDEKELEHKRQIKSKKREGRHGDGTTAGNRRQQQRGPKGGGGGGGGQGPPHPPSHDVKQDASTLPYDDADKGEEDDDGPYRPLARPTNYGISAFAEPSHPPPRGRPTGRGGGRGNSRGARGGLNPSKRGGSRGGGGGGGWGNRRSGGGGGHNQDAWRENRQGAAAPFDDNQHQSQHQQLQQLQQHQQHQQLQPLQPLQPLQQPQHPQQHHQPHFSPPAPSAPASQFNFSTPGWPHAPLQSPAPPPTAGTFGAPALQFPAMPPPQLGANGAYVNPAFFASLLAQMQQQQGRQGPGP